MLMLPVRVLGLGLKGFLEDEGSCPYFKEVPEKGFGGFEGDPNSENTRLPFEF